MVSFTTRGYQAFIRQQLECLTPLLVGELQEILAWYCWDEDSFLRVDVHSGDLGGPLPMTAALCQREEVLCFWRLAHHILHVIPQELAALPRQFDEAGVEVTEVALQTLIEWFVACWQQAGGRKCRLPARIGIPGDIEAFDLQRDEWVQITVD